MRFGHLEYLNGLWAIVVIVLFLLWAHKRKKAKLRVFADEELLPQLITSLNVKKQVLKSVVLTGVFIFSLLALLRPQWGFHWHEVKRKGLDILIAMDVSKSMLATDVKPNRLQRSKLSVRDLIKKLRGDRIGLIAFSGTSYLQCPLTADYDGLLLALNDLSISTIPRGGTSLSSAIYKALESYEGGHGKYKVLVIITDGENHEGDPLRAAEIAKDEGVKIFCVGMGTANGDLIQLTDENGKKSFLKDSEGNVVKSRLSEEVLQNIAVMTGGTYVRSSGAEFGLDLIYDEKLSKLEKKDIKTQMSKYYFERFQIPLSVAFIFLVLEPFISEKKKK